MRFVGRILSLTLICILSLIITVFFFAQTSFAQKKFVGWIEKKTQGAVTIGKLEGVIPFWAHVSDLGYHTEQVDAYFDKIEVVLLPTSLLFGRFDIIDLHIDHAQISSQGKKWPSTPIHFEIHHLTIDHLSYNGIKDLTARGKGEIDEDFSFQLTLSHPHIPSEVHLTIDGNKEQQSINTIAHFKTGSDTIWLSGIYLWDAETFKGTWHGQKEGLQLSGEVNADIKNHHLTTQGMFLDRPFQIDTELVINPQPISFQYGDDHWKMKGQFDLQTETLTFHLRGRAITWKKAFIPEIVMEGTYHAKSLDFSLSIPACTVLDPAYEVFPDVGLSLTGTGTVGKVSFDGRIDGLGENPFSIRCELPIHFNLSPFHVDIDEKAPFYLRVHGQGSINPILEFLENASLIARGAINLDLEATGTWHNPQLAGCLVFNGQVESFSTGATFRDMRIEMEGAGNALQIQSLTAHDGDKGTLVGSGQVFWNPEEGFPFELHLFAKSYQILGVDPLTLTVNSEMMISGSTHGVSVTGGAELVKGHLNIPSDMPVQVPCIDVCYVNAPCTRVEIPVKANFIPVTWDLMLEAPRHLIIEGRGLDSEWGGFLHITGEQNDFRFNGKLKLVQGRLDIINRTFGLVHGRINIEGLKPADIYIDLKGDYELPSMTASIVVTGLLNGTHVAFCSNPPLNTNQILSWILFQQDINELTPMQACRLATLLVSLSGKYTGPKTFEKIKDRLGIDVFSITDCDIDSADLTFQVGKYISQGTFVGINKSISGDYDSVLIQTRLYRNFYLEADYGGSLNQLTPNGGKAILKWYKTY